MTPNSATSVSCNIYLTLSFTTTSRIHLYLSYLQYSVNIWQVIKHDLEGRAGKVATQQLASHQDQGGVHSHNAEEKECCYFQVS